MIVNWMKRWAYRVAMLALISILAVGFAYSVPADLALLFAADMSMYLEAVVTVYIVTQVARIRPMIALARCWLASAFARIRGRTAPRRPVAKASRVLKADNDDDGRAQLGALAA